MRYIIGYWLQFLLSRAEFSFVIYHGCIDAFLFFCFSACHWHICIRIASEDSICREGKNILLVLVLSGVAVNLLPSRRCLQNTRTLLGKAASRKSNDGKLKRWSKIGSSGDKSALWHDSFATEWKIESLAKAGQFLIPADALVVLYLFRFLVLCVRCRSQTLSSRTCRRALRRCGLCLLQVFWYVVWNVLRH